MSPIRAWTDATAWSEPAPDQIAIESTDGRTGDLVYVRFMDATGESQIVAPFAAEIESAGVTPDVHHRRFRPDRPRGDCTVLCRQVPDRGAQGVLGAGTCGRRNRGA